MRGGGGEGSKVKATPVNPGGVTKQLTFDELSTSSPFPCSLICVRYSCLHVSRFTFHASFHASSHLQQPLLADGAVIREFHRHQVGI